MTSDLVAIFPGLDVSRETINRLESFAALVIKWSARINLISAASVPDIWLRHIIDSSQLFVLARDPWQHWVDLGSGGGFPGIVLAVIALERHPSGHFTLVESDQRKAAFLRTAIREFGLNAKVLSERAEATAPLKADILTARALGPLAELLGLAERHLAPDGQAIFPKGRRAEAEILAAQQDWSFNFKRIDSITDPEAEILQIKGIKRA